MSCEFSFARTGRTRSEGPYRFGGNYFVRFSSRAAMRRRNVFVAARGSSFLCGDGGCDNGHIGPPCSIIIISSSSSRRREQWQNRRHHTATVSAAVIQFLVHQLVHAGPPREHPSPVVPIFPCIEAPIVHVDGRHKRQAHHVPSGWALLVLSASSPGLQYELRVQEELRPLPLPPHHLLSGLEGERVERTDGSETLQVETAMMMGRRPETETSPAKDWGR